MRIFGLCRPRDREDVALERLVKRVEQSLIEQVGNNFFFDFLDWCVDVLHGGDALNLVEVVLLDGLEVC